MIRLKKYETTLDAYMSLKDAAEVFQKIAEREEKEQLKQRQTKRENELKN
ncbi:hypothetical protein [Mammaliicoccus sciuri]